MLSTTSLSFFPYRILPPNMVQFQVQYKNSIYLKIKVKSHVTPNPGRFTSGGTIPIIHPSISEGTHINGFQSFSFKAF